MAARSLQAEISALCASIRWARRLSAAYLSFSECADWHEHCMFYNQHRSMEERVQRDSKRLAKLMDGGG